MIYPLPVFAEFELKYTYRAEGFKDDEYFSIEEIELN